MKKKIIASFLATSLFIESFFGVGTSVIADARSATSYMKSYKKLENKCKKKFTHDGAMVDMASDANEEYGLWKKELEKDLEDILDELDDSEAGELLLLQRKWKKKMKKKAAKEASEWGSASYSLMYITSMKEQTKKRIKWLIKNYAE